MYVVFPDSDGQPMFVAFTYHFALITHGVSLSLENQSHIQAGVKCNKRVNG